MFSVCLMADCLTMFCLVKARGFAHLAALGIVSMIYYMIFNTALLVDLIGMHNTCPACT